MMKVMELKKVQTVIQEKNESGASQEKVVDKYTLSESYIDPTDISYASPINIDLSMLPEGLSPHTSFSQIILKNGKALNVVGESSKYQNKSKLNKQILHG